MEYVGNLRLYGFDEYNIIQLPMECIDGKYHDYMYPQSDYHGVWLPSDNPPIKVGSDHMSHFDPAIIDHKEVLQTAKSIYVHPCCKLSRTIVSAKYSKSLNPWLSDAVAVPKPNVNDCYIHPKILLFANDAMKMIFAIKIYDYAKDLLETIKEFHEGMYLQEALTTNMTDYFDRYCRYYKCKPTEYDCNVSELIYAGPVVYIPDYSNYLLEIFTGNLPLNKLVFEGTLQESLGTEENKPTAESLLSIMEMLESTDPNTVSVALKSLSAMDYMHYPNSVKYILRNVYGTWRYNYAMNSVAVKFMIKHLNDGNNRRNRLYFNFNHSIGKKDYELYKEIYMKHERFETDEDFLDYNRYVNFMEIKGQSVVPILLEE